MKKRVTTYTFDASAKTVDSADFTSLDNILLIVNVTDGIIIYNFADANAGGTLAGTTLTLEYDTTAMDDADNLIIFVDDGVTTQVVTDGGGSLTVDNASLSDLGNSIYTDGTGTVTKGVAILGQDGTNPQAIKTDSSGELQVDVLTLPSISGSVEVTNASGANAIHIQDGGNSITVDGSVSVSGSVTALASASVNTSALALESGGNLAAAATSLNVMDDWDETDRAKVNIIAGQAGVAGSAGAITADTQRVVTAAGASVAAVQSGNWSASVTNASGAAAVNIQDGGNVITIDQPNAGSVHVVAYDQSASIYAGATAVGPVLAYQDITGSGWTSIGASVSGKKYRILSMAISSSGTTNIYFGDMSSTQRSGTFSLLANGGFVLPYNPLGWFQNTTNLALGIFLSASSNVGCTFTYILV